MAAAVASLTLTGCADHTGKPGGPSYDPAGSPSATALTPSPSQSPSTRPEDDPTFIAGQQKLRGTVMQGAEPGCWILQTPQGQFELLNPKPTPRDGDRVTVVGHEVKAMSHCMQGRPFLVATLSIG